MYLRIIFKIRIHHTTSFRTTKLAKVNWSSSLKNQDSFITTWNKIGQFAQNPPPSLHHNYNKTSPWKFYFVPLFSTHFACSLSQLLFLSENPCDPGFLHQNDCSGLTLAAHQARTKASHQAPTKASLSLPSTTGQGRENIMKGSWAEIRTRRDHSPNTVTGKTACAC